MNKPNNNITKQFFGHPFGLLNLFSTEFCERFSYYGMRAILVYYIYAEVAAGGLGLSKQDALYAMSLFGASVYFLSIIGGWLADRVFGTFKSVFIGGIIMASGQIVLSLPFSGLWGTFIALSLIAIGTGLLKPNVSSMVGALYKEGDNRRDAGFNLFVMGINLGSLFSPLITGGVSKAVNYHVAFSIPAVFMIIALLIYKLTAKNTLGDIGKTAPHPLKAKEAKSIIVASVTSLVALIALVVFLILINALNFESFSIILPAVSLVIIMFMFLQMFLDKKVDGNERKKVLAYIVVFIAATIFWAIEELQSSVFAVLAEERVDNKIGSFEVPAAWYQSINPLVIVAIAPVLAIVWTKWRNQPSSFGKIAFGIFLTAISFVIPGVAFGNSSGIVSPLILIIPIIIFSVAELFISPIGLSATTSFAPKKYYSRFMAIWFLSNTLGQGVNAFCMRFFDDSAPANFFIGYAGVAFAVMVLVIVLLKPLNKLIKQ